jgi:hypothetical protein
MVCRREYNDGDDDKHVVVPLLKEHAGDIRLHALLVVLVGGDVTLMD